MGTIMTAHSTQAAPPRISALPGNLSHARLVCLVDYACEPPSAAEALATRLGADVDRLVRAALIEAGAIRHRRAVGRLGQLYAGVVCSGLDETLATEIQQLSGLPMVDAKSLCRLLPRVNTA